MNGLGRSLVMTGYLTIAATICLLVGAAPLAPQEVVATKPGPTIQPVSKDAGPAVAPISMSDADGQELILEDLSARTAIQGMLSLTELEFRFRNPKPRRIEGRFSCTLPQNAAISRFAKEVNGQLMEGEVVERLRANQVYEQFLHQLRDPALLEQDQGNRFSARIFPIEANATVRLVLSYSALLPLENGIRRYSLPLRGVPKVNHLSFRAFVSALPGEEGPGSSTSNVTGLANATHSTADVISIDEHDYTPAHDIELTWHPTSAASRTRLLKAGDFYLAAFRPDVPSQEAPKPHEWWTFYMDTSASSAEGAEHRIRALEKVLSSLPAEDHVQLRAFDQEIVTLTSGPAVEVAQHAGALLRSRLFLGGTDLRNLFHHIAHMAQPEPNRTIVVASDLVATLGTTDRKELTDAIKAIPERTPIHALILGSREDAAMAKALTAGRGRVVTIPFSESMDDRARAAAEALRRPLGTSFDVADNGAQWVYPSHFDDVRSGDEIIVLGRMKPAAEPSPRINGVAVPEGSFQSLPAATFGPLLQRESYRTYLEYLAERETTEPAEAVRSALATEQVKVSIEQRVVIPRTTMLVLETEWDYQRFGLDRRALASILTIDAGGIGVMDRHNNNVAFRPAQPAFVPATRAAEKSSRREIAPVPAPPVSEVGGVEGGVEGGVAGGVVGGVMGGTASTDARQSVNGAPGWLGNAPTGAPADAVAQAPAETGGAGAVSAEYGRLAPPAPRPAPMAAPSPSTVPPPPVVPPPAAVRPAEPQGGRHQQIVEAKIATPDWAKPHRPTREEVDALQAKLDADPRNRDLYNRLSDALVARAEWDALRRMALRWQPYDPENPQVYEVLGIADEQLGNASEAARAEASLIEIAPAKVELLQRAGLLLLRTHHADLAEPPLRRALELRPDRVNSYRSLALMLWREGRLEEAARVLESATHQQFPNWYGNVQRVVSEELGYIYRAWLAKDPAHRAGIEQRARDYNVDLARKDGLRITLTWETDANDVDLHVVDPNGEDCYYSHKRNESGLELYEDITQGLGPEVIRAGALEKGTYQVGVNYFSAGPMGVSRGIVVVMQGDNVDIYPFRLVEGGRSDLRFITSATVK